LIPDFSFLDRFWKLFQLLQRFTLILKKEVLNDVSFYLDSILKREQKQAVMNVADV